MKRNLSLSERLTPGQARRREARIRRRAATTEFDINTGKILPRGRPPVEIPRWTPKNRNVVGASAFLEARKALYSGLHGLQRKVVIGNLLRLFDEMERRASIKRCRRVPGGRTLVQKALDRLHRVKREPEVPCGGRVRTRYETRPYESWKIEACVECGATV